MREDITEQDLSDEERRDMRKRKRLETCSDSRCGGCPACLDAQGYVEDEP